MELTPDFKVEVNGSDVTDVLKKHQAAITLKDESGDAADELSLEFNALFMRPAYQDEIKLWLGYKESGLYFCGLFRVQTTQKTQNALSVRATSSDFSTTLKKKHTRSFENITLCDLLKKIATQNNLKSKCDIDGVFFKHLAQTNESDLNLLQRLSKIYNATFNIKNNTLLFVKKQKEDEEITFTIPSDDAKSYSIKHANKTLYKSVKAMWHDTKENKHKELTYKNGEPQYILQANFKDEAEALKRAEATLQLLNAATISGSLTITGRNIVAGGVLKLVGFGEDDGKYTIKRVSHTLSSSGYVCRIDFEN